MARPRRQFADNEIRLVRRMRNARATTAQIAQALGASESTVKRRLRDLMGEHPRGPAPTVWSERERGQVVKMAACGIPREAIARIMGISTQRLRNEFEEDLLKGSTLANYAVAKSLFEMATRGGNVTAAIFWAKTRMGWRDRGPPSAPSLNADTARSSGDRRVDLHALTARMSDEGREALRQVAAELGLSDEDCAQITSRRSG